MRAFRISPKFIFLEFDIFLDSSHLYDVWVIYWYDWYAVDQFKECLVLFLCSNSCVSFRHFLPQQSDLWWEGHFFGTVAELVKKQPQIQANQTKEVGRFKIGLWLRIWPGTQKATVTICIMHFGVRHFEKGFGVCLTALPSPVNKFPKTLIWQRFAKWMHRQ